LVRTGIDRLDLDAGIFFFEIGCIAVNNLRDRAANGYRVVE
jgi:hypothetical protein